MIPDEATCATCLYLETMYDEYFEDDDNFHSEILNFCTWDQEVLESSPHNYVCVNYGMKENG